MKKKYTLLITLFTVYTLNIYSQNNSLSFDPLTFFVLLLSNASSADVQHMWFGFEANFETVNNKELGLGMFLREDKFALRGQYRTYFNKTRQSGFFTGFYGILEYRKMHWFIDTTNSLISGWSVPFESNRNVYHSIGISAGVDLGFRLRIGSVGITPYFGLGVPLFILFGNLPSDAYKKDFILQNIFFRAINIGLRFDFFANEMNPAAM